MPTPFESATLNLTLYDLRREPALREARAWFLAEFNPETFTDFCRHIEAVVLGAVDAEAIMTRRRAAAITPAKAHASIVSPAG